MPEIDYGTAKVSDILKLFDGKISSCKQLLASEGFINDEQRLRLQGETECLEGLRYAFERWNGHPSERLICEKESEEQK